MHVRPHLLLDVHIELTLVFVLSHKPDVLHHSVLPASPTTPICPDDCENHFCIFFCLAFVTATTYFADRARCLRSVSVAILLETPYILLKKKKKKKKDLDAAG